MFHFLKIHGLVIALCLVAPAGRTSATVLLDDSGGALKSTAADIVRDAAGLTDADSSGESVENAFAVELDNPRIALAAPPVEFAGQRWTSFSDATDVTLVEVGTLDYKLLGVSLTDVLLGPYRR